MMTIKKKRTAHATAENSSSSSWTKKSSPELAPRAETTRVRNMSLPVVDLEMMRFSWPLPERCRGPFADMADIRRRRIRSRSVKPLAPGQCTAFRHANAKFPKQHNIFHHPRRTNRGRMLPQTIQWCSTVGRDRLPDQLLQIASAKGPC